MAAPLLEPKITVRFEGPFFGTPDPGRTVRQNIRSMIAAIVKEGEADVQDHYPTLTGRGRAGVRGRVLTDLKGVISETFIYPWAGNSAGNYRGGKTEAKYHMFRRTASRIRSFRAVIGADLTRGLE